MCKRVSDRVAPDGETSGTPYARGAVADLYLLMYIYMYNLPIPAYDILLQNSHSLNLLDSKQAVSATERQAYILRLRKLSFLIAQKYLESREKINFPLMKK